MFWFRLFGLLYWIIHTNTIQIKVKQGNLLGTREITVFTERAYVAFYRVPYAQPPIGKLRFRDPQPPKKWKTAYDATTEYRGACAQPHIVHKYGLFGVEDCLYMNVYTPALPKKKLLKPVIVFIHGYAFSASFSHVYSGDFFIDNDVLFITMTHRLGVFGFLKLNASDSNINMGLKDIIMALQWVQINIKQFGGDKRKVTVMAHGSAATMVSLLMTNMSERLFSKIITQSGAMFSASLFQRDTSVERDRIIRNLKEITTKDITKASAKDIVQASLKIYSNIEVINLQRPIIPFVPEIVTTDLSSSPIVQTPKEFYTNYSNPYNVSILTGFTTQECISEVIPFIRNPLLLNLLSRNFKFMVPFYDGCAYNHTSKMYNEIAEKIKEMYFKNGLSEKSLDDFMRYSSDIHKYAIYKFIKAHLSVNDNKLYVYKFNYLGLFNAVKATATAEAANKVKGAASGDELCYILKCEPLYETYLQLKQNSTHRDRIFMKKIAKSWSDFAKFGNPSASNTESNVWLPITIKTDNIMLIDAEHKLIHSKEEEKMYNFWENIYNSYYSPKHCKNNIRDEL